MQEDGCLNSVIRSGVRLVWNVRNLPNLVRVCINLIIIGFALVFLCVTLFRVTVAVIRNTVMPRGSIA
jgi:hypothetical protein